MHNTMDTIFNNRHWVTKKVLFLFPFYPETNGVTNIQNRCTKHTVINIKHFTLHQRITTSRALSDQLKS